MGMYMYELTHSLYHPKGFIGHEILLCLLAQEKYCLDGYRKLTLKVMNF